VTRTVLSRRFLVGIAGVALAALSVAGCSTKADNGNPAPSGSAGTDLKSLAGSLKFTGATFPSAYYNKALDEFSNAAPDLDVTYQGVGSGQGKKDFGAGLNDFAASDSLVKAGDGPAADSWYYIPTVAAPITVSYNLSGVTAGQADRGRAPLGGFRHHQQLHQVPGRGRRRRLDAGHR
jgi:phosphate transport system substrate-binding protein